MSLHKNIILVKLSTLFIKVSKQKTVHAFQRRMTFERRDIAVDAIDVKLHLLYFCYFVCTSLAFFRPLDLFNLTLKCLELFVYLYACDMNLNPKQHYVCNLNNF